MDLQNREYQTYIQKEIKNHVKKDHSVILELDCGMGKRVITYNLLTRIFPDKKIIVFLQNYSSLQETLHYLEEEYGGVKGLVAIQSGYNSDYRRTLIQNNRVILSLPIVFNNTLEKYPKIINDLDIVIINEIDQIIRRVSQKNVLCVPWNKLIPKLKHIKFIGMSGTLRDNHTIFDDDQLKIRNELKTLRDVLPNAKLITIEDFIDTDLKEYIRNTEVHLIPIQDKKTKAVLLFLTEEIKKVKTQIMADLEEYAPHQLKKAKENFYGNLGLFDIETELLQKINRLLLLRKYVYSMPVKSYTNYLNRFGFNNQVTSGLTHRSGKELEIMNIVNQHKKSAILCSYLSTVYSLSELIAEQQIKTFIVTGKIRNKNEVINNFKEAKKKAVLLMSPVGERDIDIPDTDVLIVFDVVNSAKTIYQKIKRSRGGDVYILFYDETPERSKVRRVVSKIVIRYPWSTIFYSKN